MTRRNSNQLNIEPEFEDDGTINTSRLNRIAVPDSGGLGFALQVSFRNDI